MLIAVVAICVFFLVALIGGILMIMANMNNLRRIKIARIEAYAPSFTRVNTKDLKAAQLQRQVNRQLKIIDENKQYRRSRLGLVRQHIVRAGLDLTITQYWFLCIGFGMLVALGAYVRHYPTGLYFILFGICTFVLPQKLLSFLASRRQKKFTKHFPDAVDVLVRGLKSGLPVGECFRIIAREIPSPVSDEFQSINQEVNAGMTLSETLDRAYQRTPTQELRFFAAAIGIQSQTGGNLAEIMGNISHVLRGNVQLKEKIKALSGEAKASTAIVAAMPFLVGMMLFFMNYDYVSLLWHTRVGYFILAGALTLMVLGVVVMIRLGNIEV